MHLVSHTIPTDVTVPQRPPAWPDRKKKTMTSLYWMVPVLPGKKIFTINVIHEKLLDIELDKVNNNQTVC